MDDDVLKTLMPAVGIAAFERRADGSFAAVSQVPPWFQRLIGDGTFPFLGHVLEEATRYWGMGLADPREWGPVAEVDETGKAFHYKVTAVTLADRQYLIFQTDAGSDRMQKILQKVRAEALATEQRATADAAATGTLQDLRQAADELRALLRQWPGPTSNEPLVELRTAVTAKGDELIARLDAFIRRTA